jgi:hypothetical protein
MFSHAWDPYAELCIKAKTGERRSHCETESEASAHRLSRVLKRAFGCWPVAGVAMKKTYTDKQGQYLAFIYYYNKIHGCSPSEAELRHYFQVSPPSVHQVILTLEARGLIERTPGQARSIRLLIPRGEIPDLA